MCGLIVVGRCAGLDWETLLSLLLGLGLGTVKDSLLSSWTAAMECV